MSLFIIDYNSNQPTHEIFVGWLNRLSENYTHGFYDDAVITMLDLAPLRKYRSLIQNLYLENVEEIKLFMSVVSVDETDKLLMIHDMDGVPFVYNKSNLDDLFDFDDRGNPTSITFDRGIFLLDANNKKIGTVIIREYTHYGNTFPRIEITIGSTTYYGVMTVNYADQKTSGYVTEHTPLAMASYYQVTNITDKQIIAEIPILPKHSIKTTIPAGGSVDIVSTPTSDLFFRQGISLEALRIKYIDKN